MDDERIRNSVLLRKSIKTHISTENCNEHSCADCAMFNWDRFNISYEECPCLICSHGWKRDSDDDDGVCKHVREFDNFLIEQNRIFISGHRHVLDFE